jgi:hypothetical protein
MDQFIYKIITNDLKVIDIIVSPNDKSHVFDKMFDIEKKIKKIENGKYYKLFIIKVKELSQKYPKNNKSLFLEKIKETDEFKKYKKNIIEKKILNDLIKNIDNYIELLLCFINIIIRKLKYDKIVYDKLNKYKKNVSKKKFDDLKKKYENLKDMTYDKFIMIINQKLNLYKAIPYDKECIKKFNKKMKDIEKIKLKIKQTESNDKKIDLILECMVLYYI